MKRHVQHKTAAGYGIFTVMFLHATSNAATSLTRFSRVEKLYSFQLFNGTQGALDNANAISVHAMTSVLELFFKNEIIKNIIEKG